MSITKETNMRYNKNTKEITEK